MLHVRHRESQRFEIHVGRKQGEVRDVLVEDDGFRRFEADEGSIEIGLDRARVELEEVLAQSRETLRGSVQGLADEAASRVLGRAL